MADLELYRWGTRIHWSSHLETLSRSPVTKTRSRRFQNRI